MDKAKFLALINNLDQISNDEAESLENLVREYPYFSLGHTLIAKQLYDIGSRLADQKVRKAALYSPSRTVLQKILKPVEVNENTTQSTKTKLQEARSFLDNVKKELADFDEKMENASEEELDLELEKVTNYAPNETHPLVAEASDELPSLLDIPYMTPKSKLSDFFGDLPTDNALEHSNFFDDIDEGLSNTSKNLTFNFAPTVKLSEFDAIDLYNEGKHDAAKMMFAQIIQQQPERKEYIVSQMEILELDTSFLNIQKVEEPQQEAILFENHKETDLQESVEEATTHTLFEVDDLENIPLEQPIEVDFLNQTETSQVNEFDAIDLYNQNDLKGALHVFHKLMEINPDKKEFYQNQIDILELEAPVSQPIQLDSDDIQNIPLDEHSETDTNFDQSTNTSDIDSLDINEDNQTELNEFDAIDLYNQNDLEGALHLFHKLMEINPDKKEYYQNQIDIFELEKPPSHLDNDAVENTLSDDTFDEPADIESIEEDDLDQSETATSLENGEAEPTHQLSEIDAVILYQQDKRAESLEAYHMLMEINPDKKEYYQQQIAILNLDTAENISEEPLIDETIHEEANQETIDEENTHELIQTSKLNQISLDDISADLDKAELIDPTNAFNTKLALTESDALSYFYTGERQKALNIYYELIEKNQDKKEYYLEQIEKLELNSPQNSERPNVRDSEAIFEDEKDTDLWGVSKKRVDSEGELEAIKLINEGKFKEAEEVYQYLIAQDPSKEIYYIAQMQMMGIKAIEENKPKKKKKQDEVVVNATDRTELRAIQLYKEGDIEEAIQIYRELSLENPKKKAYFDEQIQILKD